MAWSDFNSPESEARSRRDGIEHTNLGSKPVTETVIVTQKTDYTKVYIGVAFGITLILAVLITYFFTKKHSKNINQ